MVFVFYLLMSHSHCIWLVELSLPIHLSRTLSHTQSFILDKVTDVNAPYYHDDETLKLIQEKIVKVVADLYR